MKRRPSTSKAQRGREVSTIYPWSAPTKGWFDSESIADMPDGSAYFMDNWFPETTSLKIRPGFMQYARLLAAGETVVAAMYTTLQIPGGVVNQSRAKTHQRGRVFELGSYLLAGSGYITRRGSGCVCGGDNGDADGV